QDCSDRKRAEPLQHSRPRIGRRSRVLRKGKAWLSAVVPDRRRPRIETGESAKCGGKGARCERFSSGAGVAFGAIAGNAAHSRHVICGALGRERGCRQAQINAARMEGDRRAGALTAVRALQKEMEEESVKALHPAWE